MKDALDGNAIVYCQGAFGTPNGKTAHGLVRFTRRYRVLSVVDSRYAGQDAGELLDGKQNHIPIFPDIESAFQDAKSNRLPATHLVFGLAPDGGRLSQPACQDIMSAIRLGLNVDCGLHDYLNDDPEMVRLARQHGVTLRDVRKPPERRDLHFFSGKIEEVTSFKVAVLGTDSAIGKRTTAWRLVDGIRAAGYSSQMVGTGQTAWMQGARYSIILDSLINDFVAGEIEHAVWTAWKEERPDFIFIEGQGSLMNPAYPGGFEILAAGRPDAVVLQHAPQRKEYDGFPGYKLHELLTQIKAIELISGKPVVAVTINHEGILLNRIPQTCQKISRQIGLPVSDVLVEGPEKISETLLSLRRKRGDRRK